MIIKLQGIVQCGVVGEDEGRGGGEKRGWEEEWLLGLDSEEQPGDLGMGTLL